jgi:hypothetical protein
LICHFMMNIVFSLINYPKCCCKGNKISAIIRIFANKNKKIRLKIKEM